MSTLEVRNLHKAFGGLDVISNLNLTVPPGQRRAVIGPNGAGKTTFLNLITGWLTPTSGEVLVDGQAVATAPEKVTHSGIARSFQRNMLLEDLTVIENLRVACQAFDPCRRVFWRSKGEFGDLFEKARQAAERMHLTDILDVPVTQLSYGQKRQLEVALALCASPKILLMDEPAAGTSPQERARLIDLINRLPKDLTILLVEHDMDVVFATCDIITVLSYGKVLATGTRRDIQEDSAVIEAYLGHRHVKG
ncbi:ABC transporter ATP-binding protein [Bradyrhizobium elkanii]|uniref:ABC transporter ATP-binding protein n=1 Tax=Bradyrhizobium elkanii TaxID=29448 RepID=UPI00209F4D68|nr:ABC transporter ATP-binding protein [Bradyrhizobium elkanii]MCP1968578.1 branched-chain amino acid transport system ATP-binding protein [Bradyrhizobium elkanii]MCS4109920.1 branched-chain amino acid transport system ATP-binding protein [Bradyrhizobium elkanii]